MFTFKSCYRKIDSEVTETQEQNMTVAFVILGALALLFTDGEESAAALIIGAVLATALLT